MSTAKAGRDGFARDCGCRPWNPLHETKPIVCCVCGEPATHYARHITSGDLPVISFAAETKPTQEAEAARQKLRQHFLEAKKTFSMQGPASPLDTCVHVTCELHKDAPAHVAVPLGVAYPKHFVAGRPLFAPTAAREERPS